MPKRIRILIEYCIVLQFTSNPDGDQFFVLVPVCSHLHLVLCVQHSPQLQSPPQHFYTFGKSFSMHLYLQHGLYLTAMTARSPLQSTARVCILLRVNQEAVLHEYCSPRQVYAFLRDKWQNKKEVKGTACRTIVSTALSQFFAPLAFFWLFFRLTTLFWNAHLPVNETLSTTLT